jgi:glutamate synthase domain-containing protein 3
MSAFMAQSGSLLICGDAGDALGDSLYEADIYVRGKVKSLGVDCIEKEIRKKDTEKIMDLLSKCKIEDINPDEFKRFGSERKLYNFDIDNISNY